jgi:sec-independent protein translocase protein TatA
MGALSIGHILAVVAVVALLFGGRGRISGVMGDAAQGLRAFREGLKDEAPSEAAGRPQGPSRAPAHARIKDHARP